MGLLPLKLVIVFIAYLVYDLQYCWTSEEREQDLYVKKTLALYRKLKQEPDTFLDRHNLTVAEKDLKPPNVNSSTNIKVMLFDQGYLKVKSKPEELGGLCKLELPRNSGIRLYNNLVCTAELEDRVVADGISNIKTIFQRIPPEIEDFKSLMLSLETVLNRVPHLFEEWQIAAMFATFWNCGLNVTVGGSPHDHRIIYCDDLSNNTCMQVVVDFEYENASHGWDSYYGDLMLPKLLDPAVRGKHMLAGVASFFHYNKPDNINIIRDWYAKYESSRERLTIREYRP